MHFYTQYAQLMYPDAIADTHDSFFCSLPHADMWQIALAKWERQQCHHLAQPI